MMSNNRYPFIDLAVHAAIRDRFAGGEALLVIGQDPVEVLWANGAAARLFGCASIYELMEEGIGGNPAVLRQVKAAIDGLSRMPTVSFVMRLGSGFRRIAAQARVENIRLPDGQTAILMSGGEADAARGMAAKAQRIISGFDGTDTHVAVLDGRGAILAASPSYLAIDLSESDTRRMIADAAHEDDRLVKRMIASSRGMLPAAVARLTDDPALNLLFAVEPIATEAEEPAEANFVARPAIEKTGIEMAGQEPPATPMPAVDALEAHETPVSAEEAGTKEAAVAVLAEPRTVTENAEATEFAFDPQGRPVRFVWKIDRNGAFSEASPEFADAVGPNAADIIGRKFPDIAQVFNLDPDHIITDLLSRRDTWSGKTVFWPIQGTDLVAPVDLAALPTYTRDRQFDGFRGFGIVRVSEAREDPEALGLALVAGAKPSAPAEKPLKADEGSALAVSGGETAPAEPQATDRSGDIEPSGATRQTTPAPESGEEPESTASEYTMADGRRTSGPDEGSDEAPDESEATAPLTEIEDPFRGERPAITVTPTPGRRESDKVIRLEERRHRTRDGLSPHEQAAFREIGEKLGKAVKNEAPANGQEDAVSLAAPAGEPAVGPAATESPRTDVKSDERPTPVELLPSAFALPARQLMESGLNERLVDEIPAALLIHTGDGLIHANPEFLSLTGFETLSGLAAEGGLDHLLDRPEGGDEAGGGFMVMRKADGSRIAVTARLRSVKWHDSQALLLALAPAAQARTEADAKEFPAAQAAAPGSLDPDHDQEGQILLLEVEAAELRSILETATDGVVIINANGTIRSMNGSACALFNYDEDEVRGEPFAVLFAHESQRAVMDYVNGLSDHGVSSVLNDGREVIGREASGGFLPLFMTMGRLSGSNGFCAVLRDITQWKRSEEELQAAKRAAETASSHKSDFLARVSHEIRTPLNAIIGFSEMMAEERFGPIGSPRYLEYAHDIGNSGKYVLDIVNDLLDISKIEAGQVDLDFTAVSINDLLAECVSLLQPMANSQRVIIRTSLSSAVPEVVADQRSIKQIAINLLSNAIRFTPSGGQIVVSTSYGSTGNVLIKIRDTGIGMSRKELEQAMKPFGQVGPGPRQRGEGTGLGLPLAKAMAESNRASFDIMSTPNEGTLVTITFPPQRVLAD